MANPDVGEIAVPSAETAQEKLVWHAPTCFSMSVSETRNGFYTIVGENSTYHPSFAES